MTDARRVPPHRPNAPLPPTSPQTIGPFFPRTFFGPGDNDLTRIAPDAMPSMRGERILLRGQVTREGGIACVNAVLEAWQADGGGRFRHPADPEWQLADPDFLGWGRASTDAGDITNSIPCCRAAMPRAAPGGPRMSTSPSWDRA